MKISNAILVTVAVGATSTAAIAAPVQNPATGRWYEVFSASGITWDAARAAADSTIHPTLGQAHLATINSDEENDFVAGLNVPTGNRPHLWIAGFQNSCTPEPGCGWQWINGELIAAPPPLKTLTPYTNWQAGQPDNAMGGQMHLAITPAAQGGGWADSRPQDVWGYVIEYGEELAPFSARTCHSNGPGCELAPIVSEGTIITLPLALNAIDEDAQYVVTTYLIRNDSARCGVSALSLFNGDVIVPPYLCGHPDFLVAKVENVDDGDPANDVQILRGVVSILNESDVLPDNLYDCQAPIPAGVDPTQQDVVGYQSSQGALEAQFQTGVNPAFVGTVGEVTNGCGSSRGSGPGRSYYFAGLRIAAGAENDFATNPLGNHRFLVDLLLYKLDVLTLALQNACKDKAFSKGDCNSMLSQVKNIVGDINNGNWDEASAHVGNLQKFVQAAKFKVVSGTNHSGELASRIANILFTVDVKLVPYAP